MLSLTRDMHVKDIKVNPKFYYETLHPVLLFSQKGFNTYTNGKLEIFLYFHCALEK